jgi:hypothetical protein|tara:strand:- start:260 stop:496 length:237 start_codon:yes stop_codon:yes gene_type:complete
MIHLYVAKYDNSSSTSAESVGPRFSVEKWNEWRHPQYFYSQALLTNSDARQIVADGPGEDSGFTTNQVNAISEVLDEI